MERPALFTPPPTSLSTGEQSVLERIAISRPAVSSLQVAIRSTMPSTNNANIQSTSSPNFEQFHNILIKYITSTISLNTLISKFETLPSEGHLLLNQLMQCITPASRPSPELRTLMLEELIEEGIIIVTPHTKTSFKVKRGPNFKTN